jgi:hypothetical protein
MSAPARVKQCHETRFQFFKVFFKACERVGCRRDPGALLALALALRFDLFQAFLQRIQFGIAKRGLAFDNQRAVNA